MLVFVDIKCCKCLRTGLQIWWNAFRFYRAATSVTFFEHREGQLEVFWICPPSPATYQNIIFLLKLDKRCLCMAVVVFDSLIFSFHFPPQVSFLEKYRIVAWKSGLRNESLHSISKCMRKQEEWMSFTFRSEIVLWSSPIVSICRWARDFSSSISISALNVGKFVNANEKDRSQDYSVSLIWSSSTCLTYP